MSTRAGSSSERSCSLFDPPPSPFGDPGAAPTSGRRRTLGAAAGLVTFVEASQPPPVELQQADAMSSVNPSSVAVVIMLVNPDFSKRVVIRPDQYRWVASPQVGVERMMLDRLGGEQARATSIVRYAKDSSFPRHTHPGGEEILVLSGTFSEEGGDHPAGWYLRNPPGSSHQPSSADGTTILVKVWQMPSTETQVIRIDTRDRSRWTKRDGREVCLLFADAGERVTLERLAPGERLFGHPPEGGAELLVVEGGLEEGGEGYARGSWIRLPAGDQAQLFSGQEGATIYLKIGHLAVDPMSGTR